jgi:hypothetical protein
MQDCEYLATCPIFDRFKLEGIKNFWIRLYCQGERQAKCARKAIKRSGELVPKDLLPNGEYLTAVH